jgi:putative ABC transport system substrate-binding protein
VIDRRTFMWLVGAVVVATPLGVLAQPVGKIRKIGVLNALPRTAPLAQVFLRGLRDLGYVEGESIEVEYRSGAYADFPALAEDLVNVKVDVIYAVMEQAAQAASNATTTIPIVFAVLGDPVQSGLVASLSHPGGNLTGLTAFGSELGGKRVELLKELLPHLANIGVVWNPAVSTKPAPGPQMNRPAESGLRHTEEAARALDVHVRSFPVRTPSDIADVLEVATRERIDALIVEEDPLTYSERSRIIEFAAAHRVPAIYGYRDYVVSGGLISYGANLPELIHGVLGYIDKILKGARPSDLPIEQPTRFELVVNLKTAKALGLTIPQSLLARTDEMIQ